MEFCWNPPETCLNCQPKSVPKFKMVSISKSVEFTYLDVTGGSYLALMSSSYALIKIKEISCAEVTIYDHLHLGK